MMMTAMLDKAAAAAWPFLWDTTDTATPAHDAARARMRAALQAIREPTQAMNAAGEAVLDLLEIEPLDVRHRNAGEGFTAMIDAILAGEA